MKASAEDLRFSMTGGRFQIVLQENRRVLLEGVDGVTAYDTAQMGFRCGKMQIDLQGEGMQILWVESGRVAVSGRIREVRFL